MATASATSAPVQTTLDGSMDGAGGKARRKSYPRETKLEVVSFYHENGLYRTSKKFSLGLAIMTIVRLVRDS